MLWLLNDLTKSLPSVSLALYFVMRLPFTFHEAGLETALDSTRCANLPSEHMSTVHGAPSGMSVLAVAR